MLWGYVGEQWLPLTIGMPFMFLSSIIDLIAPNYTGKIIDQFRAYNFEGDRGVYELVWEWLMIAFFSSLCTLLREIIFSITSEKIGRSLRGTFYKTILKKDVAFYDNFRTGEMLSRLGSDTQAVQDGLTTNFAVFLKTCCIVIGVLTILCTYNVKIGFITVAFIVP